MDLELKDKVALVMAGSKGLGRSSALALAREGAKIAISSRSDSVEQAATEIRAETGAEVLALRADVTDAAAINGMVADTIKAFGRIDILIINAGGPPPGTFLELDASHWEKGIELTLMSAVHACYAVIPHMLENGGGNILAIESVTVKQPINNLILSNSVRMAVIGLLKSLANEFGEKGIRVNSINPTFTWTDRVQQLLEDMSARNGSTVEEEAAKIGAQTPLGRIGTVEEFGKTVAFMVSSAAGYIHGHALMFDGGVVKTPL